MSKLRLGSSSVMRLPVHGVSLPGLLVREGDRWLVGPVSRRCIVGDSVERTCGDLIAVRVSHCAHARRLLVLLVQLADGTDGDAQCFFTQKILNRNQRNGHDLILDMDSEFLAELAIKVDFNILLVF